MKKEHTRQRFLAVTLTVVLLYAGFSQVQLFSSYVFGQNGSSQANIGFEVAVSDTELLELLQRYDVVPHAVFMWTSGLTGTHRTYEAKNAQAFFQEARAKTIEGFENGLQGNPIRLQRFVERYTEEEVVANADLQQQARSLLNIRAKLEAGLAAAESGGPLIYAMEVSGDPAQIELLSKDEMVKAFQPAMEIDGKIVVPPTPKPPVYEVEYLDPDVQAMSPQELYRQMEALAITNPQGG